MKCLTKDRADLLAFYDFPAEHWNHIRTSNPIKSTFATVRHRTTKTKGCPSRQTALAMTHQLLLSAKKKWCRLDGQNPLPEIIQGVEFRDEHEIKAARSQRYQLPGMVRGRVGAECNAGFSGGAGLLVPWRARGQGYVSPFAHTAGPGLLLRARQQLRFQPRSNRSAFITLAQAATKSCTNFRPASAWA